MASRSHFLAAVTVAVAVVAGHAQEAPARLTGIVEVPAVLNRFTADGQAMREERPIVLRARPALDSAVVATIAESTQLEAEEYTYEESGAVAYDRRTGWTLVKTSAGVAGWLAPADAGTFHSLESLLDHRDLAELTDDWDGWLRPSAGSSARRRVPVDPGRSLIGFLEPTVEDMTLLPIFERADQRAPVVARVAPGNPERALKTTGQVPYQIVVLDRQPGWFRVARAEQIPGEIEPAWLPESPVWLFHDVTNDAERRELGRDAWGPDNPDVRVLGTQRIGETLWVNIEVLDHSFCVGKTPIVRQRGWIPAHAPSGKLNIWYPSRGC